MNIFENEQISTSLQEIFCDLIKKYEVSFALINLGEPSFISGYNLDKFIYPASMSKVFIGAEVLRQIELGKIDLDTKVSIVPPNDVDKDISIFHGDTRDLLCPGDEVSVDYLLNLMLSRSDNTASNCLLDLVTRESINQNIINFYEWRGSDLTRKYLDRAKEDERYKNAPVTMSCARHFAELFYRIHLGTMVSFWVSEKLKSYMSEQNNHGIDLSIAEKQYLYFFSKGGWLESRRETNDQNLWTIIRWSSDAKFIQLTSGQAYILVYFSIVKTREENEYFPYEDFEIRVKEYMEKY